jgi:hypothetical protein
MELTSESVPAFRKTFDISIEGRSHREAVNNVREEIGGGVSSAGRLPRFARKDAE